MINLEKNIDRLGEIAAIMAELKVEEAAIKNALIARKALGYGKEFEGSLFRVTISHSVRSTVNWKAVATKLEPSRQLITAYTKESEVNTVRVTARMGVAA